MMEKLDELIDQLAQDTVAKPAPHPYMLSLKLAGWGAAYLLLTLVLSGVRPDLSAELHRFWFAAEITALVGIFVTTSFSAALLSFPDMHQKRGAILAPVLSFALFLLVILFAWHADNPPAPLPVHSFQCTIGITLVSILPAGWTFYAMRQLASTHYHLAGCIALLSAFSVGALWLRLHELNDSILHLLEWHYLPMIAFGVVGMWLGKRFLKW